MNKKIKLDDKRRMERKVNKNNSNYVQFPYMLDSLTYKNMSPHKWYLYDFSKEHSLGTTAVTFVGFTFTGSALTIGFFELNNGAYICNSNTLLYMYEGDINEAFNNSKKYEFMLRDESILKDFFNEEILPSLYVDGFGYICTTMYNPILIHDESMGITSLFELHITPYCFIF